MPDNGPVILITGTSKGIGHYLARYYAGKGLSTVGCSRRPCDIQLHNYQHILADITDEEQVRRLVRSVERQYQRLDILINNAGTASMNHVLFTPGDTVRRILETNVVGTFLLCREAARVMRKRRYGRIVNIGTVAVPMRIEGESIYAASKGAIVTFTQILARELAPFNITCNVVGPTPVETDLIKSVPPEKIQRIVDAMPIKRLGTLADISNVIDFFIREESDYVTGQVIYLGGVQ
ncbi:MAG TPA: SDR family oxidoreductase [Alphaproteobacteria bacterium]|nr:SDR family oxidoreductase [Alphaproteobacteria bacterium]